MSTFDRVRRNILKDMAASTTHNAESWIAIMLRNTARLTDVEEQKKFWEFLQNPEDEERPPPTINVFEKHDPICFEDTVKMVVDGKEREFFQEVTRNGKSVKIVVKGPVDVDDEKDPQ